MATKKEPKRTISLSFIVMIVSILVLGFLFIKTEIQKRKEQKKYELAIESLTIRLADTRTELAKAYQIPDTIVREKYIQTVVQTQKVIKHEYAQVKKDSVYIFTMSPDSLREYSTGIKERIDRLEYENSIRRAEADSIKI